MRLREKGYKHYGITEEHAREIIRACMSADKAHTELLREACIQSNPYIHKELYRSITENRSYDRFYYIPIGRSDFYGYRRKAIAIYEQMMTEADNDTTRENKGDARG